MVFGDEIGGVHRFHPDVAEKRNLNWAFAIHHYRESVIASQVHAHTIKRSKLREEGVWFENIIREKVEVDRLAMPETQSDRRSII